MRLGLFVVLVIMASDASAGHWVRHNEATPPPGRPRVFAHSHARAGDPLCVSNCARPGNGPAYVGYSVGGGSACHGCARRPEDGTFGWDYRGVCLPRHVDLFWSHGRRAQAGTGSYRTDGP